jgi:hypothetical protein
VTDPARKGATIIDHLQSFLTQPVRWPNDLTHLTDRCANQRSKLSYHHDQTTAWGTTGMKTMALTSAQAVPAGYFYVALWANGTTRPTIRSAANNSASINGVLSAANSLWATADSSVTTTAPSSLGTFSADNNARWVGVS